MEINKIHEITFNTEDTIITATTSSHNQIVMLMSTGDVIRYKADEPAGELLFSVKSNFTYEDGGFDLEAKITIYTIDEIVVVVNDFKRHGFVHYPGKYRSLHLWRQDHYADITAYPITLFKNEDGIPHLIYSEAWNHVQIMNLETRQILTAAKSLIEENAEQRHMERNSNYSQGDKLPWPRPYDYFFGKLHLSPNQKKFLSAGWGWGSCDSYNIFSISQFIESNRISYLNVGNWEHENRAVCWIDNDTVAVAYNPLAEGDENTSQDSLCEFHLYKIDGDRVEIVKKIPFTNDDIVKSSMYYNKAIGSIVSFSDKSGLSIFSMDGKVAFKDKELRLDEYNPVTGLLTKTENRTVCVFEVTG